MTDVPKHGAERRASAHSTVTTAAAGPSAPKPLCTSCAYPTSHVYTTYTSAANIRLGVCARCDAFLDPLIESPALLLALDLVLLKPRVFLHLLFNRGSPPLDASGVVSLTGQKTPASTYDRRKIIWTNIFCLSLGILVAEVFVRRPSANPIAYLAGRVVCETVIQLAASTALALLFLRIRGWHPYTGRDTSERRTLPVVSTRDGRQEGFLPSLVPLVLLYTAIMPLWLQLILGVWYDGSSSPRPDTAASVFPSIDLPSLVPLVLLPVATQAQQTINEALDLWQGVDRVWAGTRILSGMSAAFGLRVLLPTRPWETTAIVMAGWGAAGAAGRAWDILWEKLVSL